MNSSCAAVARQKRGAPMDCIHTPLGLARCVLLKITVLYNDELKEQPGLHRELLQMPSVWLSAFTSPPPLTTRR
jgi:hypothetical protein